MNLTQLDSSSDANDNITSNINTSNTTSTKKTYDVYFGRGNRIAQRLGNRIYHRIIKEYQPIYQEERCPRAKTQVAETIIDGIHILKGTFYSLKNGIWAESSTEQAVRRVKQALQGKVQFRAGSHIATTRKFLKDKDMLCRKKMESDIKKTNNISANSQSSNA